MTTVVVPVRRGVALGSYLRLKSTCTFHWPAGTLRDGMPGALRLSVPHGPFGTPKR